ncbi:hypothetical protein A2U01_0036730 [Trifolium medium]|uniref:Uncharacterized protein n=1 Tax=Trifolium medium TaxID=97028 RepID=A0A392PV94_9FABA|nr:hypothetical protein [Trifolium medium]
MTSTVRLETVTIEGETVIFVCDGWQQLAFGMMRAVDMDLTVPRACEERISYRGCIGTIVSITLDLYEKPP